LPADGLLQPKGDALDQFERQLSWMLLLALTLMLTAQIIARYVFFTSISWIEEFSRIIFIWYIYLSISWITLQGRHIRVNAIDLVVPASWRKPIGLFGDLVWLGFCLLLAYYGYRFVMTEIEVYSETAILHLPHAIVHAIIPVGFGLMSVRLIQTMIRVYWRGGPEALYLVERQEEER
jgi:TRAP-type C4-dicarboxylate transport system permease small subunit